MSKYSYRLWQGKSAINGKPIEVIATGVMGPRGKIVCSNSKTGKMTQIWIIPTGVTAKDALSSGDDEAICGSCRMRPVLAKARGAKLAGLHKDVCYLSASIHQGHSAQAITNASMKGRYQDANQVVIDRILKNPNGFRWGAWGDPLAVPVSTLRHDPLLCQLTNGLAKHTAYTHQWAKVTRVDAEWVQTWCMASVDSPTEAREAQARGWRTFRSRGKGDEILTNERMCPASKEAGRKLNCARCRQCDGTAAGPKRPNFVIIKH